MTDNIILKPFIPAMVKVYKCGKCNAIYTNREVAQKCCVTNLFRDKDRYNYNDRHYDTRIIIINVPKL